MILATKTQGPIFYDLNSPQAILIAPDQIDPFFGKPMLFAK